MLEEHVEKYLALIAIIECIRSCESDFKRGTMKEKKNLPSIDSFNKLTTHVSTV